MAERRHLASRQALPVAAILWEPRLRGGEGGCQVDLVTSPPLRVIEVDFVEGFKAIFLGFIGSVAGGCALKSPCGET